MVFLTALLIILIPEPHASERALADFSRFQKAAGAKVSMVDVTGIVREGVVAAATADALTMTFGAASRTFPRADVASAERLRDGVVDGVVKGALFGALMAGLASQGCQSSHDGCGYRVLLKSMTACGALGWALDASQHHRRPLYRAAAAPKPSVGWSFRF